MGGKGGVYLTTQIDIFIYIDLIKETHSFILVILTIKLSYSNE